MISVLEVCPDAKIFAQTISILPHCSYTLAIEQADLETVSTESTETTVETVTNTDDVVVLMGTIIRLLTVIFIELIILIGAVVASNIVRGFPKS